MKEYAVVWFLGLVFSILIGVAVGNTVYIKKLESEAIELGYAEYNSTNGHWQWKQVSINK